MYLPLTSSSCSRLKRLRAPATTLRRKVTTSNEPPPWSSFFLYNLTILSRQYSCRLLVFQSGPGLEVNSPNRFIQAVKDYRTECKRVLGAVTYNIPAHSPLNALVPSTPIQIYPSTLGANNIASKPEFSVTFAACLTRVSQSQVTRQDPAVHSLTVSKTRAGKDKQPALHPLWPFNIRPSA